MKILIIAEHDNKTLKSSNYHVLTAASELGGEIDLLILGYECVPVVAEAQKLPGVKQVLVADNKEYEHQLAENCAQVVADIGKQYNYILSGSTTFAKNLLPRAAALLDVGVVADVIKIMSPDTFQRPIFAGNALATVQSEDAIKILTIRTTAFAATNASETITANGVASASAMANAAGTTNVSEVAISHGKTQTSVNANAAATSATVESISAVIPNTTSQFVSQELTLSKRPELTSARIVVAGGRGLKSADNFKLIEKLADRLGAAIGASRAAVDAGFAPNDYQVGQTGKVVAPELYIAIGISGAIQHLAGMKDSKVIVAINKDPDAPIFQIADYGLVGDLFAVLTELDTALGNP